MPQTQFFPVCLPPEPLKNPVKLIFMSNKPSELPFSFHFSTQIVPQNRKTTMFTIHAFMLLLSCRTKFSKGRQSSPICTQYCLCRCMTACLRAMESSVPLACVAEVSARYVVVNTGFSKHHSFNLDNMAHQKVGSYIILKRLPRHLCLYLQAPK